MRTNLHSPVTWANSGSVKRKQDAKENPMDRKRKAIGPDGRVVEISLSTGRGIPDASNPYKTEIEHYKAERGWVWYEDVPESKREKLIAERQAVHNKRESQYAESFKTGQEKVLDKLVQNLTKQQAAVD